jgi:glycosyltransferase involved in cell wall biosynthesis
MHVLFVHQNYPAQFGHIARHLVQRHGFRCTFVSQKPAAYEAGIRRLQYASAGGATSQTHFGSRTFENQIWGSHAVFRCLAQARDVRPDLIVGHSGFVSTMYLRELYSCPMINYFEYFYRARQSDIDFRHDLPPCGELDRLRSRTRNALLLLDLENCDAGYAPTQWQRSRLPRVFQPKIETIFDGIETEIWWPRRSRHLQLGPLRIDEGTKLVTYVSRGFESLRGFDRFMQVAQQLCRYRPDVLCLVVGEDRVVYGGDARFTGDQTFKQWVLAREPYDLSRIRFLGRVEPRTLARILSRSDLHLYWTAPFILSWSLLNALACGATVLASDTAPVREVVQHGVTGLLTDFFAIDGWVQQALRVLTRPDEFRSLGVAGTELIRDCYSLDACLPRLFDFYQRVESQ